MLIDECAESTYESSIFGSRLNWGLLFVIFNIYTVWLLMELKKKGWFWIVFTLTAELTPSYGNFRHADKLQIWKVKPVCLHW